MDKYRLRRAILDAVQAMEPAPSTVDEVATFPLLQSGAVARDDVQREIAGLINHAYLEDLRPGRTPLLRLTPAGADQINRESDLAEYIWGELASRFARGGSRNQEP